MDPRRRRGKKIPCYWVHIRRPYVTYSLRDPTRVEKTMEDVRKPKGHTHCRSVQEAYALACDVAATLSDECTIETRMKNADGQIVLIGIKRGELGPSAKRGFRVLGECL